MQAVIMAGGKGTRLSVITNDEIPKAMVKLCNKPILEYQINVMKNNNITEIILIVGHLHEKIIDYFGDGSNFGVSIKYIIENEPLGTAGAFYYLKEYIRDDFILVFGDLIFDISVSRMASFHKSRNSLVTLLLHPNSHPYDSDLILLSQDGKVEGFDSKNNKRDGYYRNIVNSGIYMINNKILDGFLDSKKTDLEKDIIVPLIISGGEVYGYQSPEYVRDVGTPERLKHAERDINNRIVQNKNLVKPQKCIFLDRDGTINKYVGLLSDHTEFELEEYVVDAIKLIHTSEYLAIVITNQPVVARNLCSMDDVNEIHKKMETLLGQEGAYLDEIQFCPHHPDKGYPEENPIYKIECNCRKPKTGLIEMCSEKFNIDLNRSWLIGDSTIDVQTGINAGIQTVLLKTGVAGKDGKFIVKASFEADNLLEAVEKILNYE